MADVELGNLGNRRDWRDIVIGQSVACVRLNAVARGERGGVADPAQLFGARGSGQLGIGAGVKFDDRRAQPDRGIDLACFGCDEQADANPCIAQPRDDWRELVE